MYQYGDSVLKNAKFTTGKSGKYKILDRSSPDGHDILIGSNR